MVLYDLYLKRFDFDKGFVIWHFLNYCLVQIVLLWSFSIGVRLIFTTNKFVDRTKNLELNASQLKKIFNFKNAPQARFFMKKDEDFGLFMGTLSYWYSV